MPFLLPHLSFRPGELGAMGITGTCEMQICRSAGPWSMEPKENRTLNPECLSKRYFDVFLPHIYTAMLQPFNYQNTLFTSKTSSSSRRRFVIGICIEVNIV